MPSADSAAPDIDVAYVAGLARLHLTPEEQKKFQPQLQHIVGYVAQLQKVDVSSVKSPGMAEDFVNRLRADEPQASFTPEQALANAPRTENGLFLAPKSVDA